MLVSKVAAKKKKSFWKLKKSATFSVEENDNNLSFQFCDFTKLSGIMNVNIDSYGSVLLNIIN